MCAEQNRGVAVHGKNPQLPARTLQKARHTLGRPPAVTTRWGPTIARIVRDAPTLHGADVIHQLRAHGYRASDRTVYLLLRSLRPSGVSIFDARSRARLAKDLKRLRLTPREASRRARFDSATVESIIAGDTQPEQETIRQLLASVPIDPAPYTPYVADEFLRCTCGDERPIDRGHLTAARRRRKLRRAPDGTWLVLCKGCARRRLLSLRAGNMPTRNAA